MAISHTWRGLIPSAHSPPQVRRGHPTVHSETKYVELTVINDHQLVSPQAGGTMAGGPKRSLTLSPFPFFPVRADAAVSGPHQQLCQVCGEPGRCGNQPAPSPLPSLPPPHTSRGHCQPGELKGQIEALLQLCPPTPTLPFSLPHLLPSGPRYIRSSSTPALCWLPWKHGQMGTRSRCRMTSWRP